MAVLSSVLRWKRGVDGRCSLLAVLIHGAIVVTTITFLITALSIALFLRYLLSLARRTHACILRRRVRSIEQRMEQTSSYDEWRQLAIRKDEALKLNRWKTKEHSDKIKFYKSETINEANRKMRNLITRLENMNRDELKDQDEERARIAIELGRSLRELLKKNFEGLGLKNAELYCKTHFGTKHSIEDFYSTVIEGLQVLHDLPEEVMKDSKKLKFVEKCRGSFGRTAISFSGGASLGYYHFGVIKTLAEQQLLPKIISGSSSGALVAAFACCRHEEELKEQISPEMAELLTACSESWPTLLVRKFKTGALFDKKQWYLKSREFVSRGHDYTFEEVFAEFGKVLNITVASSMKLGGPILLNYRTTPRVVVWSAVVASAAMPGLLNPIELYVKRDDGSLAVFEGFGKCWNDGRVATDLPAKELAQNFDVSFSIVSQVTPYAIPFLSQDARGIVGTPMAIYYGSKFGFAYLTSYLEHIVQSELKKWIQVFDVMRLSRKFDQKRQKNIVSGYLDNCQGDVTIFPDRGWKLLTDLFHIISDPTRQTMQDYIEHGARHTFPRIHMIEHHMRLEQILQKYDEELRIKVTSARQRAKLEQRTRYRSPFATTARRSSRSICTHTNQ